MALQSASVRSSLSWFGQMLKVHQGIYILPMYTIPQVLGGLAHYLCRNVLRMGELSVVTIAVGLILGQSLVNVIILLLGFTGVLSSQ